MAESRGNRAEIRGERRWKREERRERSAKESKDITICIDKQVIVGHNVVQRKCHAVKYEIR